MAPRIFLFLIIILSACNNSNSIKTNDNNKDENNSKGKTENLNDSIFFNFINCASNSDLTEIYWCNNHAVVIEEDISENLIDNEIILGYSNDITQIKDFIDSFPEIKERPEAIESVKIASNDNLIFICGKDTLIDMSWDIGKHQIHINVKSSSEKYFHQDHHKIDFYKLDELLKKIAVKKN
jgi:hypothetical protein